MHKIYLIIIVALSIVGCATPVSNHTYKANTYQTNGDLNCSAKNFLAYSGKKDQMYLTYTRTFYHYNSYDEYKISNSYVKGLADFDKARSQLLDCSKLHPSFFVRKLLRSCAVDFTSIKEYPVYPRKDSKGRSVKHEYFCDKTGLYNRKDAFQIYNSTDWLIDDLEEGERRRPTNNSENVFEGSINVLFINDPTSRKLVEAFHGIMKSLGFTRALEVFKGAIRGVDQQKKNEFVNNIVSKIPELYLNQPKKYYGTNFGNAFRSSDDIEAINKIMTRNIFLDRVNGYYFWGGAERFLQFYGELRSTIMNRVYQQALENDEMDSAIHYVNDGAGLDLINEKIDDKKFVSKTHADFYFRRFDNVQSLKKDTKQRVIDAVIKARYENSKLKHQTLRVDYVSTKFAEAYKAKSSLEIIIWAGVLRNYNKMDKPSLKLFEAEAYYNQGFRIKAKSLIDDWLTIYGKKNKWYRKVLGLYSKL